MYPENKIIASNFKVEDATYFTYTSLSSTHIQITKVPYEKTLKMNRNDEQLAYHRVGAIIEINKDQIIEILAAYAKKDVKRNNQKDYFISLQYFVKSTTKEISYINFQLPKTLLKDLKQIKKLEYALIANTRFLYSRPPVPEDFKPKYFNVTVTFNQKDLTNKF